MVESLNSSVQLWLARFRVQGEKRPWLPLLVILLAGLMIRLILLPTAGFAIDLVQFYNWSQCAIDNDWFGMYDCDWGVTHPPLGVSLFSGAAFGAQSLGGDLSTFDDNPWAVISLKLPTQLFEIALIALVYFIVWKRSGVLWAAGSAALLTFNPGFGVVTAWWGQTDSIYVFFVVLAAYLLRRGNPLWAWIVYGLAFLSKFQSVMFLPVLGILTFRRYGFRITLLSVLSGAALFFGGMIPFLLGSGEDALNPFTDTVDLFPYITHGAYNLWFWLSGSSHLVLVDTDEALFGLTYFQVGMLLLVAGMGVLSARAWLFSERDDDYLLLAAANLVFFNLPTQMQVRYLYAGLVFLVLWMPRWRGLVVIYLGLTITFTYNVFDTVALSIGMLYYPFKLLFWSPTITALAETVFFVILLGYALRPLWTERHDLVVRLY